ncbi:MAG: SpoIIE family protein phosphatase [Candidatus Velthaea sp.]
MRDVRVSGQNEPGGDGGRTGLVGFILDVTEQRRSEAEVRKANRLMTMAGEIAHYGHWHLDLVTGERVWSEELYRIWGLPAATVPTFEDSLATYGEYESEVEAILRQAALDGRPFRYEAQIRRPDGTHRDVRIAGRGERDPNGKVCGLFGVVHDVTELRDAARERTWSTTFQRAVLPLRLPHLAGCSFDAVYDPGLAAAQVGGDWYDALELVDGRVLVSIGDVSGSGLSAAVVGGVMRQVIRGVSQVNANPVRILDAADRALRAEYPGVYVSAWVGLIDLVERTIVYAAAGHPPPLVVSADGSVDELHDPTTLLIGLREGHRAWSNTRALSEGDTLVMYTDGVTEAGHDVLDGYRRVREAAALVTTEPSDHPARQIKQHVIPEGTSDDVAILVVRIACREAGARAQRWRFDVRDAARAETVRGSVVLALERQGFGPVDRANAELVLGELIGNVVRHALPAGEVDVIVDRAGSNCVLHVLDRGPGFHHAGGLPSDPYAEDGRGLFLIAALALDFSVSGRSGGGSHARAVLSRRVGAGSA